MKTRSLFFLLLISLISLPQISFGQVAQKVTVRQINAIPASNIAQLEALGENLTTADIEALVFNELLGALVEIDVVVLSEPHNSGLAGLTNGRPDRVHVFVRDIAALKQGVHGMGIQLVDASYESTGLINAQIGDVIRVTGTVAPFGTSMQITPVSIETLGTYRSLGLPKQILNPKVITTDRANQSLSNGAVQTNWQYLSRLSGQFVQLRGVTVDATNSDSAPGRYDFYVTSDGGNTILNFYDTSIRYRNDRDDYPDEFNKRTDADGDFVPPPVGSVVNIQGFLVLQPLADQIGRSVPLHGLLSIVPFEDRGCDNRSSELRCDLQIIHRVASLKNSHTDIAFDLLHTTDTIVEDFALDAAYPNPFNPTTAIRYSLPEASSVKLVVYNMLGQEVQRLVDGVREAGIHEVIFEAGDLPSGTYLYRLETPNKSFTNKMLLLK